MYLIDKMDFWVVDKLVKKIGNSELIKKWIENKKKRDRERKKYINNKIKTKINMILIKQRIIYIIKY